MSDPTAPADEELIERAHRGDAGAFADLYERYAPAVHGVLLARAPHAEVDDLMQETFLKAMRSLRDLRDAERFGPWITTIARNLCADHHRAARRLDPLPEELPGGRTPALEASEILDLVRQVPDPYREPLMLRLVEGLTGPEIAARIGMTHGSVRVNLHRGMKELRERLQEAGWP